jgi:WD40 repeat protein
MTFSPDGKTLAVSDFNVMLFDVAAGKRKRTLTGHRGSITQLAYSKDGKRLASASSDSTVLIWETGAND